MKEIRTVVQKLSREQTSAAAYETVAAWLNYAPKIVWTMSQWNWIYIKTWKRTISQTGSFKYNQSPPTSSHGYNCVNIQLLSFLAATKQLYEWISPSVRLSVCPPVRHTFLTMFPSSYHHETFRSYYQWQKWRPCKRSKSKVKVTEVTTQLNRFRTVTPVWIHIWWWNDAYSLIMLRRGALLFFKVIRQISRSHSSKNLRIWPKLGVSGL